MDINQIEAEIRRIIRYAAFPTVANRVLPIQSTFDKVKSLSESRGINFSSLEQLVSLYWFYWNHILLLMSRKTDKKQAEANNQLLELVKFIEDGKPDKIKLFASHGSLEIDNEKLLEIFWTVISNKVETEDLFLIKSPTVDSYRKRMIQCTKPLFDHLRSENPDISKNDLYRFIANLLEMYGISFDEGKLRFESEVEEVFKTYYRAVK